jgi:hypothetical protein
MPDGLPGPQLKHKIILAEEDGKITLDITGEDGGGLKLFLDLVVASRLGQDMAERARHAVAKASDDPARASVRAYSSQADRAVSVGQAV